MNFRRIAILLLFALSAPLLVAETKIADAPGAGSDAKMIVALILGTKEENPPDIPWFLKEFESDLAEIFGYNRYDLMSISERPFREHTSEWLIPSNDFQLKIDAGEKERRSCSMEVGLYHHEKRVLQSKVRLTRAKPLFIAGPEWGRGRLIIVLIVQ